MINLFKVFMSDSVSTEVPKTLSSGKITQGSKVDEFENALSDYLSYENIVTVNSCTSAIHLALNIIKEEIGGGDIEVISAPMTCAATNMPILSNGMKICWCDVDNNLNLDLDKVSELFTTKTRILMVIHWGGIPLDYSKLEELKKIYRKKFNQELFIVEDCAHAA